MYHSLERLLPNIPTMNFSVGFGPRPSQKKPDTRAWIPSQGEQLVTLALGGLHATFPRTKEELSRDACACSRLL
jgi:hypothetical protein